MNTTPTTTRVLHRRRGGRRGFTLVEAAMSVLILGVLMTVAMNTLGQAGRTRSQNSDRAMARLMADALMAEIMEQKYSDPGAIPLFGREATELLSPRTGYNDVDDYNGLVESPPQEADGNNIPGGRGMQRKTVVEWVLANDLTSVSAAETWVKRITVTVTRNNVTLARRVGIRTSAGG